MNELIEDYQRKINSVNELLKNKDNDKETINRLKIKVGCYRSFLTDLNRAFNIDDVSKQRELLLGFKENEYFDLYEQGEVSFKNAIEMYLTQ
jgi:hypothetical protein|tara:strand:+ start:712 stop:987 length:276 start_codon:yes stop_codon:yes gene_type:complete